MTAFTPEQEKRIAHIVIEIVTAALEQRQRVALRRFQTYVEDGAIDVGLLTGDDL